MYSLQTELINPDVRTMCKIIILMSRVWILFLIIREWHPTLIDDPDAAAPERTLQVKREGIPDIQFRKIDSNSPAFAATVGSSLLYN